ncbi:hypothetical protein Tco_0045897 [Tanacetum coccineum]
MLPQPAERHGAHRGNDLGDVQRPNGSGSLEPSSGLRYGLLLAGNCEVWGWEFRFSAPVLLRIHQVLDCSPTNRERELGLDRRETVATPVNWAIMPKLRHNEYAHDYEARKRFLARRSDLTNFPRTGYLGLSLTLVPDKVEAWLSDSRFLIVPKPVVDQPRILRSEIRTDQGSSARRITDRPSVLASLKRLVLRVGLSIRGATSKRNATWLILPVVICLSQRLSHACDVFINQERSLGARRRSDTVLVSTINDADQGSADVAYRTSLAPYEKSKFLGSGGSMVARLKLKGIDGRAPPGVEPAA